MKSFVIALIFVGYIVCHSKGKFILMFKSTFDKIQGKTFKNAAIRDKQQMKFILYRTIQYCIF